MNAIWVNLRYITLRCAKPQNVLRGQGPAGYGSSGGKHPGLVLKDDKLRYEDKKALFV